MGRRFHQKVILADWGFSFNVIYIWQGSIFDTANSYVLKAISTLPISLGLFQAASHFWQWLMTVFFVFEHLKDLISQESCNIIVNCPLPLFHRLWHVLSKAQLQFWKLILKDSSEYFQIFANLIMTYCLQVQSSNTHSQAQNYTSSI